MTRLLGVDLGGTNIKAVVLELAEGAAPGTARQVARATVPTRADGGPEVVTARIAELGAELIESDGPIDFAAVGVPGLFDAVEGRIVLFPNLPGDWPGQPMPARLAEAWGVPTALVNDARAFTLAEARLGAGAGLDTVVCVTVGTGIGGGVVVHGKLRSGPHGRAGEVGHQVLIPDGPPCGCGNAGCVEALARADVLAAAAGVATAREAYDAARGGDARALGAVHEVAGHLGHGLGNLVTVLVPQRIVVGGGIAEAGDALLEPLREAIARTAPLVPTDWYDVVPAQLGNWAGAVGAALWALESQH